MDAKQYKGEPRVLISRDALLHNVSILRAAVGNETKICAILKADAYGHGAAVVADALCSFASGKVEPPAIDAIAVASIDEAEQLPEVPVPVIIFRPVENCFVGRMRHRIEQAIRNEWMLTICTPAAAADVARIAIGTGKRAAVQVMIDTGMTRSGVCAELLPRLMQVIASQSSLRLAGICTHFACSEDAEQGDFTREQFRRFQKAADSATTQVGRRVTRHAANTGAIFFHPQTHLDMVRPGIALYGLDPLCRPVADRKLRPAMKWVAPLINIRDVKCGTGIGYGQTWHAERDCRIGLVPVGYADGYSRSFSNRAKMMIHGQPAPVVGRVSMDLTTIDLTNIPNATIGEDVTILDNDPLSPASVYELARLAETIPYEILCSIGQRIHRVAVDPADDAGARPVDGFERAADGHR